MNYLYWYIFQACLSIASHVAGTIGKNVVYIDTVGGFSAARIHEILTEKCVADGNIMVKYLLNNLDRVSLEHKLLQFRH